LTSERPRPPESTLFPYTTLFRSFAGRVRDAERKWDPVDLIHSFRSSAAVLRLVDAVFENEEARRGLHFRSPWLKHDPVRVGQGRSEEHTSELQSRENLVSPPLLE